MYICIGVVSNNLGGISLECSGNKGWTLERGDGMFNIGAGHDVTMDILWIIELYMV